VTALPFTNVTVTVVGGGRARSLRVAERLTGGRLSGARNGTPYPIADVAATASGCAPESRVRNRLRRQPVRSAECEVANRCRACR
jgi:hypothetical protein